MAVADNDAIYNSPVIPNLLIPLVFFRGRQRVKLLGIGRRTAVPIAKILAIKQLDICGEQRVSSTRYQRTNAQIPRATAKNRLHFSFSEGRELGGQRGRVDTWLFTTRAIRII